MAAFGRSAMFECVPAKITVVQTKTPHHVVLVHGCGSPSELEGEDASARSHSISLLMGDPTNKEVCVHGYEHTSVHVIYEHMSIYTFVHVYMST